MENNTMSYEDFSSQMEGIRSEFESSQKSRDSLIKQSRDIVSYSKKVIYSIHRNDSESAEKYAGELDSIASSFNNGLKEAGFNSQSHGFAANAMQEYVEAKVLLFFYSERKIMLKQHFIDNATYLSGLCDLSGELLRMAINNALTDRKLFDDCKMSVTAIFNELMLFDLPNSELRRKFDSLKYAVKRLEETALELGMKNGK